MSAPLVCDKDKLFETLDITHRATQGQLMPRTDEAVRDAAMLLLKLCVLKKAMASRYEREFAQAGHSLGQKHLVTRQVEG